MHVPSVFGGAVVPMVRCRVGEAQRHPVLIRRPVRQASGTPNEPAVWLSSGVKKSIDFAFDDHPDDDDKARVAWAVAAMDDCGGCDDLRVELTLEDAGASGTGVTAHLAPRTVRRLRAALGAALREIGEPE